MGSTSAVASTAARLSPQEEIEKSNEIIKQQGETIVTATENKNTAKQAKELIEDIENKLTTGRIIFRTRYMRQIQTCEQFEEKFEELLDLLNTLTEATEKSEIENIDNLVTEIINLNIDALCSTEEKTALKQKTETKINT